MTTRRDQSTEARRIANARSQSGALATARINQAPPKPDLSAALDRLRAWLDVREADE